MSGECEKCERDSYERICWSCGEIENLKKENKHSLIREKHLKLHMDSLVEENEKLRENIIGLVDHLDACGAYMSQEQADKAKENLLLNKSTT